MFSFLDYVNEVWTVSCGKKCDVGMAFDYLRTDIKAGHSFDINTGDCLPDFDYAKAKVEFDKLTREQELDAIDEYFDFRKKNYHAICEAFPKGKETVNEIVENYRKNI